MPLLALTPTAITRLVVSAVDAVLVTAIAVSA
jgi:hypothetical protein